MIDRCFTVCTHGNTYIPYVEIYSTVLEHSSEIHGDSVEILTHTEWNSVDSPAYSWE